MFKTIATSKMIKQTPIGTVIYKISCLRPSLLLSKAPVKLETAMTMLRKRVLSNKSLWLSPPKPASFIMDGP